MRHFEADIENLNLTDLLTMLANDLFYGDIDQYDSDCVVEYMRKNKLDMSRVDF